MRILFPLVGVLLLLSPLGQAQSLGEVAAREKQKKKQDSKPVKVMTEDDLRSAGSRGAASVMEGSPEAAASPAPGAAEGATEGEKKAGEKTPDELKAEAQKAWREKLQAAEQDVARLAEEVEKAQTALNDLSGAMYGTARASRIERLEASRRQLAAAQQRVEDTREEGRRQGFR